MAHDDIVVLMSSQSGLEAGALAQLPAGLAARTVVEVVEQARREPRAIVVLNIHEAQRLLAEPALTERVLLLVCRQASDTVPDALLNHPRLIAVLDPHCSQAAFYAALNVARMRLGQTGDPLAARKLEDVLEIGRALASEKDLDVLLSLILTHARHLTQADGASIYTLDESGKLYFRLWQNASTGATADAQKTLVGDYSIAGYVARCGQVVEIEDAYHLPDSAPYRFNPASDKSIGYHTQSMLTLPLKNKADEVVGVLQLINKKDDPAAVLADEHDCRRHVRPFAPGDRLVALALAGQAGVALENSILYADIERLFEGFIRASVHAIEARDPTTAGHSFRVAEFTERLAKAADRADVPMLRQIHFGREQLRELRYAALLHDFGKVGVRENVLVKANKLYPHELDGLRQRFRYARASIQRAAYRQILQLLERQGMTPEEVAGRRHALEQNVEQESRRLNDFLDIVLRANQPSVSQMEVSRLLATVSSYTFPDENEEQVRLLNDFEFAELALSKGSLNPEERREIESHVSHTFAFLSLIPWTRNLAGLPEIAYAHHEKLDGSGYPRGLSQEQIPVQSRIMTIADIYDALTAGDRPYKHALTPERALDILGQEATSGKVDAQLYQVFVASRAYELPPA